MEESIKIIIVDDHEIFRNGLKMVLGKLPYVHVVGEAGNGQEFLDMIRITPADVVLMDIEMPVMSGIDATTIALKEHPGLKVIALTMFQSYFAKELDGLFKYFFHPFFSNAISEISQIRGITWQLPLKPVFPTEILHVRILNPSLYHALIA